eukprot:TRINITY_DN105598_c0_g1_i1.p1 TRINITY_DN105598_c0_g1~~TRINITY_DN105598_c0_g1_i1.p1  ORF type:complete len:425 (+),score=50.45 TRINITY_DN105598_c0_g1_i1:38-1312(+)
MSELGIGVRGVELQQQQQLLMCMHHSRPHCRHRSSRRLLRSSWKIFGFRAALAFAHFGSATALVDCTASPDCTLLRRRPCDVKGSIPNACGDCLPGRWGGLGPMNTVCLGRKACVAVHPGHSDCKHEPAAGRNTPFIFPFERCVCDDGSGRYWPTQPGKCGQIVIKKPEGAGYYEAQICSSRTCEPSSCNPMAEWPSIAYTANVKLDIPCKTMGEDAVELVDDCDNVTARQTASNLCRHTGFTAVGTVFDALGSTPIDCELAPRCPSSVLQDTRLSQTCCTGNIWAKQVLPGGQEGQQSAPGFCPMVYAKALGPNETSLPKCIVRTGADGWTGCACVNSYGQTSAGMTCTVSCEPPHCIAPSEGIRPVPAEWATAQQDSHKLFPGGGAELAKAVSSAQMRQPGLIRLLRLPPVAFVAFCMLTFL